LPDSIPGGDSRVAVRESKTVVYAAASRQAATAYAKAGNFAKARQARLAEMERSTDRRRVPASAHSIHC
jgi:hypothetical protein